MLRPKNNRWLGIGAVLCAVVLIAVGVSAGQHSTVYARAIRVCLECIGIG